MTFNNLLHGSRNEIAREEVFSSDSDFSSEINDTRQSKSVIILISVRFYFLSKALNIKSLPELILHGIQIAYPYNGAIEILKSNFPIKPNYQ